MADDKNKKPDKKPEGWNLDPLETLVLLLFIAGIGSGLIFTIKNMNTISASPSATPKCN